MRGLFSADWQTNVLNIPSCEQAAENVLKLCKLRKLQFVCIAGDLKAAYNPVDLRVLRFWMGFIGRMCEARLQVIILLGNHDRIGLYNDEHNWLPVLEKAGATVYSDPGFYPRESTARSGGLVMLPFAGSPERWAMMTNFLAGQQFTKKDILVFHQSVAGTKATKHGQILEGVPLSNLRPEQFRYCLGGHIHLCQRIGPNVHYIGSPFATDWGEANQQKYFAVLEDDRFDFVPTGLPGWYDPTVPGFREQKSWIGSRVRVPALVPKGVDYGAKVAEVRHQAEQKYPGAIVTVVTKFESNETDSVTVDASLPEHQQIAEYVGRVLPTTLSSRLSEMLGYLGHTLQRTGRGLRNNVGVRFQLGYATGFLCFDELKLDFDSGGVVLVTGRNLDWAGRSNGSGKTSALSVIPAALFGRTFKGQTHDGLSRQGFTKTSKIGVTFKTGDGRQVRVERSRNPTKVQLWVDDVEISAGSRSTDVSKDIERLCGFSWDTFAITVYLDQEEISNFLWGTPKQKEETLSRLQNLERFASAQELVKITIKRMLEVIAELQESAQVTQAKLDSQVHVDTINSCIQNATVQVTQLEQSLRLWSASDPSLEKQALELSEKTLYGQQGLRSTLLYAQAEWRNKLAAMRSAPTTCSQCGQPLPKRKQVDSIAVVTGEIANLTPQIKAVETKLATLQETHRVLRIKYETVKTAYDTQVEKKRNLKLQLQSAQSDLQRWQDKLRTAEAAVQIFRNSKRQLDEALQSYDEELQFLRAASAMLGREGLPTYLSQLICPKLNKAADYFSELFTEGEIQVKFTIDEKGISVDVVNANGGHAMGDQSTGERRMAALITSFALREVTVKSNVLILDEPGDGLDPSNARAFAQGVASLRDKFGTIFVMTHNANIESELSNQKAIVIEKRGGVSSIC